MRTPSPSSTDGGILRRNPGAAIRHRKQSVIRAAPERVFAFHELPDALARLTPPWERGHVVALPKSLAVGEQAVVDIRLLPFLRMRCVAVHTAYDPPRSFEDRLVSGPFRRWVHRHVVSPHPEGATLLDDVDYEMPFGVLGRLLVPVVATPRLERLFAFRHQVTREWCEAAGLSLGPRGAGEP
jgi:ligand-binding SRPBCC domain-containing protein